MSKRPRITADDVRLILTLHRRGATLQKIADAVGLSYHTTCKVIQFYKIFKEIEK